MAKTKNLGIVKMNKIVMFITYKMGNEHPSFFK
jgi:hypothetical protein